MDAIPSELVIVGGIGLVILAAVIVAKWGRQILLFCALAVGVVVLGVIVWAVLQNPDVIPVDTAETIGDLADIARVLKPEPQPAPEPVYTAPAPIDGGFCAGVFVALLLMAVGVGGYFRLRWKLAERGTPTRRKKRREVQDPPPVVYIVQGQDLDGIPWEELAEWTDDDFVQF